MRESYDDKGKRANGKHLQLTQGLHRSVPQQLLNELQKRNARFGIGGLLAFVLLLLENSFFRFDGGGSDVIVHLDVLLSLVAVVA